VELDDPAEDEEEDDEEELDDEPDDELVALPLEDDGADVAVVSVGAEVAGRVAADSPAPVGAVDCGAGSTTAWVSGDSSVAAPPRAAPVTADWSVAPSPRPRMA
jgi:hypothetical protein